MASTSGTSSSTDPSISTSGESFRIYEPSAAKLAFRSGKRYDVFLSFRGEDLRKTFVDHLYKALSVAGLSVYKDDEKLKKGELIWPSLEAAIGSSSILIPIFSKHYADSAWCLKEASAMLETSGLIIPLFYYVDPTHVRYPVKETSPYSRSFQDHRSKLYYKKEEIDRWIDALRQICDRSGWSMDITDGFEARMVKMVVNDLLKTLGSVPLEVAKNPVGLDEVKNALIQQLNLNSVNEVVKIGIWGIGGIGKTTVAKAVYNQIYLEDKFDAACFVPNVRATAEASGLEKLQEGILKNLSEFDKKVNGVAEGITLLRNLLREKRVLLVLDDVDAVGQLNALVGDWLVRGSRVIVISRNKHILKIAGVSNECIHEMGGLEMKEGLELFSWHAFFMKSPSANFEDLSKRIVEACKGHPLSLEVVGSSLYDNQDTGCWEEALNIMTHDDIYKTLYISYSTLTGEEKEMFVDIACFFIGENKTLPIVFWKSMYKKVDTAILNLSMKLLIKIDDRGFFDMHDHLRDMGRIIAETEKEGTRLWEATHLSTVSDSLSRLRLIGGNPQSLEMLYTEGLRYLHLQNLTVECMPIDTLFMLTRSLIWLSLENCSFEVGVHRAVKKPRHSRIVDNIWQCKIMQLKGCSNLELLIFPLFSLPNSLPHLQLLDLGRCESLRSLPDSIGNLSHLQHLNLGYCYSLCSLPDSIRDLSHLQHLNLEHCFRLSSLPNSIGNLSQLKHLNLRRCTRLSNLPDSIANLSQLQELDLGYCDSLSSLPDSIVNLLQLQKLVLAGYRLSGLPHTIGNLFQLHELNLECSSSLNILPDSIGKLSQLQKLKLGRCSNLSSLPDTICNLTQVQILDLYECKLSSLPDSIGNLSQLQRLNLAWCKNSSLPDSIGKLSQLQHLDLGYCKSLSSLPDSIGNLSQLHTLDLRQCRSLSSLPDSICNLSQLQKLNLRWLTGLRSLPNSIGNLSQLKYLNLEECHSLSSLPDSIGNLTHLQELNLRWCKSLKSLPDIIGKLPQLRRLDLVDCESLNSLPDSIANQSQLELNLGYCKSLSSLHDCIGNFSQLQRLNLRECENLSNLPVRIGSLSRLRVLDLRLLQLLNLSECGSLNSLPDSIGNLSQLQTLNLSECGSLNSLPDSIGNLSQLQSLNLSECGSLNSLPDSIGNLSQLQFLNF